MPSDSNGEVIHFGRDIDYLEDLGAKLRNLKGFATLANELLQNADDVPGVTDFIFDMRDEALIIENSGRFSDCEHVEEAECPWKEDPAHGAHRCDFHRFRKVAGGDKRNESGTTGAFGIGFISVYQITDRPEVISGRHWILDESQPGDRRIAQCGGCERCSDQNTGTQFYLPWASEPDTVLRKRLRAEPTTAETPGIFVEELERCLPPAMLFLKKLDRVEIRRNGDVIRTLERTLDGDTLHLSHGSEVQVWHLLRGDFSGQAEILKSKHGTRIEAKRSGNICLAIPQKGLTNGLLCATLPTQQTTGLPFHINADFFPTEDRKRIILEKDYQGEWNLAALDCAAQTLSDSVVNLRDALGHKTLWEIIEAAHKVAQDSGKSTSEGATYAKFWTQMKAKLAGAPVVFTSRQEWKKPPEVYYLIQESERENLPVLEGLGLEFVHEDLRPHQNVLITKEVGTPRLSIDALARHLNEAGLTSVFSAGQWPAFLAKVDSLDQLWREIEILSGRPGASVDLVRPLSLATDRFGDLRPCETVYRAEDVETETLFLKLDSSFPFASTHVKETSLFKQLCPAFGPAEAEQILSKMGGNAFTKVVTDKTVSVSNLISWFADHRAKILKSTDLKVALATLPIYPSAGGFRPLNGLSLPGDFEDPLQLASVLDVALLPEHHDFLRELGIEELSFPVYVSQHLIPALQKDDLDAAKRRGAAQLVASRRSEISEDAKLRLRLAEVSLVECRDGVFRKAGEVYSDNPTVTQILGPQVSLAVIPSEHPTIFAELHSWLGVAQVPRVVDILKRIRDSVAEPPEPKTRTIVQSVFNYLASTRLHEEGLSPLKALAWLPSRQDILSWHKPEDLYATYQDYLFESQAKFLDVDSAGQQVARELLKFLGISLSPPAELVVSHLLLKASGNESVNDQVYRFLNDNADDPAISRLRGCQCLLLTGGQYVSPMQVFWSEHPFGRYRQKLGEGFRPYHKLLRRLEVREQPTWEDAVAVILEISEEFGPMNTKLDEESHAVCLSSWKLLDQALNAKVDEVWDLGGLSGRKTIPNAERVLYPAHLLFFEDRGGLVSKFGGYLTHNTLNRPISGGKAMAGVGVRSLSDVVETELLECEDPIEDDSLRQRVRERRQQIGRVIITQVEPDDAPGILQRLDSILFERTATLRIRYGLTAFGQTIHSDPEDCPALYRRHEGLITYAATGTKIPWAAIARELAMALVPNLEPGRIAAGLKEVLSATDLAEAREALDELGFPVIATDDGKQPPANPAPIGGFGGTAAPGPDGNTDPKEKEDGAGAGNDGSEDNEERSRIPKGNGTGNNGGSGGRGNGTHSGDGGGSKEPPRRQPHTGKLRSYVIKDSKPMDGSPDPKAREKRSEVEKAGIVKVLAFERKLGCEPTEMPVNNPGYDIESRDQNGNLLRYIEVKSMSGPWDDVGVGLTATEFAWAQKHPKLYCLYVVERALDEDAKMHFIQDPASKVDEFRYDSGWQQAAETDTRKLLPPEDW
jgi:hypothetical protein